LRGRAKKTNHAFRRKGGPEKKVRWARETGARGEKTFAEGKFPGRSTKIDSGGASKRGMDTQPAEHSGKMGGPLCGGEPPTKSVGALVPTTVQKNHPKKRGQHHKTFHSKGASKLPRGKKRGKRAFITKGGATRKRNRLQKGKGNVGERSQKIQLDVHPGLWKLGLAAGHQEPSRVTKKIQDDSGKKGETLKGGGARGSRGPGGGGILHPKKPQGGEFFLGPIRKDP